MRNSRSPGAVAHRPRSPSSRTCASSSGVKSFTILNLRRTLDGREGSSVSSQFHSSKGIPALFILEYYQQQSEIFRLFNGCQMDIRFTSEAITACESLPCSCPWSWRQPERTPLNSDALRFTTCYSFITHGNTLCHVTDLRASQVQKAFDVKIIGSQNQLEKDLS